MAVKKAKTKTINLRLPLDQITAIKKIAVLAGTSPTIVFNVILAMAIRTEKAISKAE